jgi:hypothetical protein|tara:strand:- start:885 stop:1865 length:981 start_codon:yes stop_codon:yes gene_type:complete
MAKQNRTTLKGYFETGDVPTQENYIDFIDSTLNLSEVNSDISVTNITASGNISASNFSGTTSGTNTGDQNLSPYLLSANTVSFAVTSSNVLFGDITSSGNISASGTVEATAFTLNGTIVGSSTDTFFNSGSSGKIFYNGGNVGIGTTSPGEKLEVIGNISASGNIIASKLNTGQGLNELYDMDQNVKTTSAVTFTTVNTGQGANELYDMNQNVTTTSNPTFAGLNLTKVNYETLDLSNTLTHTLDGGPAGYLSVRAVPSIGVGDASPIYNLTGDMILATSVIMISTNALITCNATNIANSSCKITFHNPTQTNFNGGNVIINIVII